MKPLSDVNISTGQIGTVTNQKGEFTLYVKEGVELEFSHIGYSSFREKAKNGMKIHLLKKVFKLGEIIVESGLKNESFLRSTNSIDVIQQKEIRYSGADHLQEIVDRISIISVFSDLTVSASLSNRFLYVSISISFDFTCLLKSSYFIL